MSTKFSSADTASQSRTSWTNQNGSLHWAVSSSASSFLFLDFLLINMRKGIYWAFPAWLFQKYSITFPHKTKATVAIGTSERAWDFIVLKLCRNSIILGSSGLTTGMPRLVQDATKTWSSLGFGPTWCKLDGQRTFDLGTLALFSALRKSFIHYLDYLLWCITRWYLRNIRSVGDHK